MDDISEYQALRATIRERGTVRLCAVLAGLAVWATLLAAIGITELGGAARFVSLVMLAATHEVNFFIHTSVERIGRYIQVFYEEAASVPRWETTAMHYGVKFPGGLDPLFATLFHICNAINFVASIATTQRPFGGIVIAAVAHGIFTYRIVVCKRAAAAQRAHDLERFQILARS